MTNQLPDWTVMSSNHEKAAHFETYDEALAFAKFLFKHEDENSFILPTAEI